MEVLRAIFMDEELLKSLVGCAVMIIGLGVFFGLLAFEAFKSFGSLLHLGASKAKKGVVSIDSHIEH